MNMSEEINRPEAGPAEPSMTELMEAIRGLHAKVDATSSRLQELQAELRESTAARGRALGAGPQPLAPNPQPPRGQEWAPPSSHVRPTALQAPQVGPRPTTPARLPGQPHLGAPAPQFAAPAQPVKPRGEIEFGKYLLSGAAALLFFIAAVSLIALLWDTIPDIVKVAGIGVLGLALTAIGVLLTQRLTNKLPAATVTGIGAGLVFVALIGAALLELLPLLATFAMLSVWTVALTFIAAYTRQPYVTVVTSIGGIATVLLASMEGYGTASNALTSMSLVAAYVAAVTVATALTAHKVHNPKLRPVYFLSASAIAIPGLLAAPVINAWATSPAGATAVVVSMVVLLIVQVFLIVHAGAANTSGPAPTPPAAVPALVNGTTPPKARPAANPWAAVWIGVPFIILIPLGHLLLAAYRPTHLTLVQGETFSASDWVVLVFLALIALTIGALSVTRLAAGAGVWGSLSLHGTTLIIGLTNTHSSGEPSTLLILGAVFLILALSAIPTARAANGIPTIVLPISGVLLATGTFDAAVTVVAIVGILLLIGVVVAVEAVLAERGAVSPVATWLVVVLLVVRIPFHLANLSHIGALGLPWACTIAVAFSFLAFSLLVLFGLSARPLTPLPLLSGRHVFQRALPQGPLEARPPSYLPVVVAGLGTLQILLALAAVLDVNRMTQEHPMPTEWSFIAPELAAAPFFLMAGAVIVWANVPLVSQPVNGLFTGIVGTLALLATTMLVSTSGPGSTPATVALILSGALCILVGFRANAKIMRLYGLILVMVMVFKLAIVDVAGQNSIVRIVALAIAGVICFALSVLYSRLSAREKTGTVPPKTPASAFGQVSGEGGAGAPSAMPVTPPSAPSGAPPGAPWVPPQTPPWAPPAGPALQPPSDARS